VAVVKSQFDRKTKSYPVTSALGEKKGFGYRIEEDADKPRTSCKTKEMFVPLDVEICPDCNVNHSAQIRAHEMAHAKWSPKNVGKAENPFEASYLMYEGLEEVRVNYLMKQAGIKTRFAICESNIFEIMKAVLLEPNVRKKAFIYLAVAQTREQVVFDKYFEELSDPHVYSYRKDSLEKVIEKYGKIAELPPEEYIRTREVIMTVDTAVKNMCFTKRGKRRANVWSKSVSEYAKYLDEALAEPELPTDLTDLPDEMQNFIKQNLEEEKKRMKSIHRYSEGKSRWGRMTIKTAPLVQNLGGVLKARKNRPQDMGAVPRYMHRYATDQKIFYKSRRVLGGTILIDVSGSMGLHESDVMEMLGLMPAATIAMYSGAGSTGDLVIIAENGKMTNEHYISRMREYGNIIDGPALDWLGKQAGPRVWVSDGQATGTGDSFVESLRLECFNKSVRNAIVRLNDMEACVEFAKKYRKEAS
jgi:hypothetical protein